MYRVNLLPPKLQREGTLDVRRLLLVGLTTLLAASLVGGYGVFILTFWSAKSELAATEQQIAALAPAVARVQAMKTERKDLEEALQEYDSILSKQQMWSDILLDFSHITPIDVWLTSLEIVYKGTEPAKGASGAQSAPAQAKAQSGGSQSSGQVSVDQLQSKPNTMLLKGYSRTVPSIGIFVNNLHQYPYFLDVQLNRILRDPQGNQFEITATLKGDQ